VFGVTGELQGALALSAPKERLSPPDTMLAACRQVLEAAREATMTLGGNGYNYGPCLERLAIDQIERQEQVTSNPL
jgi:hypothetical protein